VLASALGLYLGPDRAANMLEVVAMARDDGSEVGIHAMRMRAKYEPFLRGEGDNDLDITKLRRRPGRPHAQAVA
jgi:hypothetical protein